jgi:hypothetical protein
MYVFREVYTKDYQADDITDDENRQPIKYM